MEQQGKREQRRRRAADGNQATDRVRRRRATTSHRSRRHRSGTRQRRSVRTNNNGPIIPWRLSRCHRRSARIVAAWPDRRAGAARPCSPPRSRPRSPRSDRPGGRSRRAPEPGPGASLTLQDNQALGYALTSPGGIQYGGRTHSTDGDRRGPGSASSCRAPARPASGPLSGTRTSEMITASRPSTGHWRWVPKRAPDASVERRHDQLNSARVFDEQTRRSTPADRLRTARRAGAGVLEANENGRFNDQQLT